MRRRWQVWFMLTPEAEVLDLTGPWSVLGYANELVGRELYALHLTAPLGGEIRTRHGLALSGARSLESMTDHRMPDAIVIAGAVPTLPVPPAEGSGVEFYDRCAFHCPQAEFMWR